ncbi:MAG: hypothetical protein ABEK50_06260 [bacterium]
MAHKQFGRILITSVLLLAAGVFFSSVAVAQTPNEVIIEGEDKQPSRSTFQYSDTSAESPTVLGTRDSPSPSSPSAFKEPRLNRDTGVYNHGDLRPSERTAVDEFSALEILCIGVGFAAVLVAI